MTYRAYERIPEKTVARLSIYLRCLEELETEGVLTVSSQQMARRFGLNSAQLRKDLAYFGQFGIRGVGYHVHFLENSLKEILGLNQEWKVALVGAGNLGSALLKYRGFSQRGFRISAVFDANPHKIGKTLGGIEIKDPEEIPVILGKESIRIGIIATPASAAQGVAEKLVASGVTSILNFAPCQLTLPEGVKIQHIDLAAVLKTLSFHQVRQERKGDQAWRSRK
jgi:redox-sensing transcriptional repressor